MNNLLQSAKQHSALKRIIAVTFWTKSCLLLATGYGLTVPAATSFGQTCRYGCFYSNTYQGVDAFPYETFGGDNTALGYLALSAGDIFFYTDTAIGALTLSPGTDSSIGSANTAAGATAMEYSGSGGNAVGASQNTAAGVGALTNSSGSSLNTAVGVYTIYNDFFDFFDAVSGVENTAIGAYAISGLPFSFGSYAVAIGASALPNANALYNTADGYHALYADNSGGNNLAEGNLALSSNTDGIGNIAVGDSAGINLTTGDNNIDLGNKGIAGETNAIRLGKKGVQTATYIAGISGKTVSNGVSVLIDSNNRLGTINSSVCYKESIRPMAHASEAILSLKPVTFRYKKKLDPEKIPQFGLIAEQVEKVAPDLVARDDDGKPFTVRYQTVNAMLLNEFLKQNHQTQEQEAAITQLTTADTNQDYLLAAAANEIKDMKVTLREHAAQIQTVNDQLSLGLSR